MNLYRLLLPAIAIAISGGIFSCKNKANSPEHSKSLKFKEEEEEKHDHAGEAMAFEIEVTKDPRLGYVPREHLLQAFERLKTQPAAQRVQGAIAGITWNERGPSNVGGRTRSILIDGNDPSGNTIFAGSVGGGLWKCVNFTTPDYSWTPVNDLFANLAVTAIAQNPVKKNIMYFGTGEGYFNADALQGGGIWKSTNSGASWTRLDSTVVISPSSKFAYVTKIMVKEVGGVEYLLVGTRTSGLQLSTDGGATFTQVLTNATSLRVGDIDIAANGDLYASTGLSQQDGMYKSIDNGATWIKRVAGLPTTGYQRIEIACAPGADSVVYATYQANSGACLGIYKSTNFGATWAAVTNPGNGNWTSTQGWYDMIATVDPDNPQHIAIGGLDTYISSNGGASWVAMSSWFGGPPQYIHADHHEMKFYKAGSGQVYLYFGNDGGVFFSANANATVTIPVAEEKNTGYNVTQFYHGSQGPIPGSNRLLAGAQDNGTQYFTVNGVNPTAEVTGGDGAFCHIDDDNPDIQISQYVYNVYFITNNNWASYNTVEIGSSNGRFINPTDYDSRTNTLYGAYNTTSISVISNVGTTNNAATKTITGLGATASAIRVSPNTPSRIFIGTSNGRMLRVDNADGTAIVTNITPTIPAAGNIAEIAVEDGDDNHIIYCISSFGANSIWETTNGGGTWKSIEGNFKQDLPVRAIMFSPNSGSQAFIGTDMGVFSTDLLKDTSTVWGETNNGLARVSVQHLEFRKGDGTMLAVSHGRGVYTSTSLRSPSVYFSSNNQQLSETGTQAAGCRKYKDINIPVVLSLDPSGPAQVSVAPHGLSNAVRGQDFDIITTMPVTFTSAGSQNIVLRIYDDAAVEAQEKIALEVSVTNPGSTNAKKGAAYLDFIYINDDDKDPEVGGTQVVFFTENWEAGIGTWLGFGTGTASAPNAWGLSNTCDNVITNQTAVIYNQQLNQCGYNSDAASTAVIYRTFDATGRKKLSIEFDWKGFGEVGYDQGEVVFDTTTATTPTWNIVSGATALSGNSGVLHLVSSLPTQLNNRTFRLGFRWKNDTNTGSNPAFSVDNIQLLSTLPIGIQLPADPTTSPTQYVGPFETVPFYDNSGLVIATLKNNNALVLGCVKLEVDRSGGGGNVAFTSTDPATFAAAKAYKLTAPDAPASGVSYDITLYYTAAEINTWTTGTGHPVTDATIIKVSNHAFAEVTPGNPLPGSVSFANAVTRIGYGAADYQFTATFNSFSGFGIGINQAILPIGLLHFSGTLVNGAAALQWTTSTETNNKGFYLERSYDAVHFTQLGFVNGAGTSTTPRSYTYNDPTPGTGVIFYRLKQVDLDGKFSYSNVVQLQVNKNNSISIFPNPFHQSVNVTLSETAKTVKVVLYSITGSRILTREINAGGQNSFRIDLKGLNLVKGQYLLELWYNDQRKQVKVMKD